MDDEPEVYADDSMSSQAILLAVETGVEPDAWLALGHVGMNTAMRHLRRKISREASYLGGKIKGEAPTADAEGRRMSG